MGDSEGSIYRRIYVAVAFLAVWMALFFLTAGRADIPRAWLFFGLSIGLPLIGYFTVLRRLPHLRELIASRGRIGKGTKAWDKAIIIIFTLLWLAVPAVAGLNVGRFRWSDQGWWGAIPGTALFALGYAIVTWAMSVNRFFECTVRIQKERGHELVSSGPYRFVRHPGYLGMIPMFLSFPLILGSLAVWIPSALLIILIIVRTALEDRMLRRELAGYGAYAQRVRYRLLPGVW